MGVPAIIAGIGLAFSVKGSVDAKQASKEQAKDQKKAERAKQKIRDLQTARERRKQVKQARIQRAEIASSAGAAGTLQTSGFAGGTGSLITDAASNISFLNKTQELSSQVSIFNQSAADAGSDVASANALSSVGSSLFTAFDGAGALKDAGKKIKGFGDPNKFFS